MAEHKSLQKAFHLYENIYVIMSVTANTDNIVIYHYYSENTLNNKVD